MLQIFLEVISGHDPKDSTSLDLPVEHYSQSLSNDLKGKKVGVIKELMTEGNSPCVQKALQNAIETYKKLGCEIVEISLKKLKYSIGIYYILATAECSSNLPDLTVLNTDIELQILKILWKCIQKHVQKVSDRKLNVV